MYYLTNQKFGKLKVLKRTHKNNKSGWLCLCDCGNRVFTTTNRLITGHSKSCGCLKRSKIVFNDNDKRLYNIWKKMKERCYKEKSNSFYNYGARGIIVCDEWLNDFNNFKNWSVNNGYNNDLTLDRIDVNGNYKPSNCRWATKRQQSTNRRNCHYLTCNGKIKTITEWAEECGIPISTLVNKLKKGIILEELLKNKRLFIVKIFNDKFEIPLKITDSQMEIMKIICKNNGLNISQQ